MGYSESVLNICFYRLDIKGQDCLYVLPAQKPDATDFSAGRFDRALELSNHLSHLFSDVQNIGHKRAGSANLYVRGSNSRSQLKSVPISLLVLDELDEMQQKNIPLAKERVSGQLDWQIWEISTPTIDNYGINAEYNPSTQEHFFFKCPHCSKFIEFKWPESFNVEQESLLCYECHHTLDHQAKADFLANNQWVPAYTDRDIRGFYINQLYSTTVTPHDLCEKYKLSLQNPADEQEFFNSKLGLPHVVEGARITDTDISNCLGKYKNHAPVGNALLTMGIDVGKYLHFCLIQWDPGRLIYFGKVEDVLEIDRIIREYRPNFCVIDANPERRMAFNLAQRFWGYIKLCFYGNSISGKQISIGTPEEATITVDRTSWLDQTFSRFHNRTIQLPFDLDLEFKKHIKTPVRIYEKDATGNLVGRYVSGGNDDHYAHAMNYAEIAQELARAVGASHDLGKVL